MTQMNLFDWADARPSNVIDARWRFEAKVIAIVQRMIDENRLPPRIDGKVITTDFKRERVVA